METRELYAKKYEAQLNEWRGKIDALHAHVQKSAAQAQIDLKPHLDGVSKHYEAAKTKLACWWSGCNGSAGNALY